MRKLRQQIQINVLDTQPNVAVGISLPFNGFPVFRSTYTTKDQTKSNIINFFLTNQGERIMNPNFGGNLRSYMFEQTPEFDQLHGYITDQLGIYFPQVTVVNLDVNVQPDQNQVSISLDYSINNDQDNISIQFNA